MPLLIFTCLVFLSINVESAKILIVAPVPTHSHFTVTLRLGKELAKRGHEVTSITPFPQPTPMKNYREIPVLENIPIMEEVKQTLFSKNKKTLMETLSSIFKMSIGLTEGTLVNENVRLLMKSEKSFDVVILDLFLNEALIGLGYHFKAPVILLSSVSLTALENYIFTNPAPASYVPATGGALTQHLSFWDRLKNVLILGSFKVFLQLHHLPIQRELFKMLINPSIKFDDVLYNNVSLLLVNSHVSVSQAVPLVPSIIEVGGFHIHPPEILEGDLQQFLDNAAEGVVVFSMGATLNSQDFHPYTIDVILGIFSKIKQRVVWKFEGHLDDTPRNVKIMKWLPQQELLGHPKVRAFITHGGFLSIIESVYYGVPVIGIPVYGDQKYNIAAAVRDGYGITVPLNELTEKKLSWALNEILNNPKYLENARKRAKLMHDQPLKPIDSAVYWVEHVIRHQGAPHLRVAGLDLCWHQREMIDILFFIIGVCLLTLILIYFTFTKIFKNIFRKKKSSKLKTK